MARKQQASKERIELLAKCDLLRHLPPQAIEQILPCIRIRHLGAGDILFRAGEPGDALYIVATGKIEVIDSGAAAEGRAIAQLAEGAAFGEMALLTGGLRTATVRAVEDTELLAIGKGDFQSLVASDRQMAQAVERISHQRAISNLSASSVDPQTWASVASASTDRISRSEADQLRAEAGKGSGLAIVSAISSTPFPVVW